MAVLVTLQPGFGLPAAEFAVGISIKMDFVAFMAQSLGGDESSVGKPRRKVSMDRIDPFFGRVAGAFCEMSHLACQEGHPGDLQLLSKTAD